MQVCLNLRKIRIEAYVRHIDTIGESECASLHYAWCLVQVIPCYKTQYLLCAQNIYNYVVMYIEVAYRKDLTEEWLDVSIFLISDKQR